MSGMRAESAAATATTTTLHNTLAQAGGRVERRWCGGGAVVLYVALQRMSLLRVYKGTGRRNVSLSLPKRRSRTSVSGRWSQRQGQGKHDRPWQHTSARQRAKILCWTVSSTRPLPYSHFSRDIEPGAILISAIKDPHKQTCNQSINQSIHHLTPSTMNEVTLS
ncbi:hypothetical protein BAUCODRAFT_441485 [Baudoinia panamericana UAMH 10762]|uniref:Uncharacterized protein n=1 Tax=Baudoinia panamericana (strain UAMH 10762) TaxID=717646 RepID=M2ND78_BAUPA|nr:uncharacterized protein BAUCODRAFT_441485 [Baudoinia panamericana UAMH 10762]EMC97164.1 hypothetical protein BAUCODRAFT_441485 [Baudoinia panamericana UAMH 10762]